jgi:SWI/SNF-related matrix-associated actin-dependent regulator of chromatin subfamily A member 5
MEKRLDNFKLSDQEVAEKLRLHAEGFPDWLRKDFKAFCTSLERHGGYNFKSIVRDVASKTGKDMKEVQHSFVTFWTNYRRIHDWKKILMRGVGATLIGSVL